MNYNYKLRNRPTGRIYRVTMCKRKSKTRESSCRTKSGVYVSHNKPDKEKGGEKRSKKQGKGGAAAVAKAHREERDTFNHILITMYSLIVTGTGLNHNTHT